ncbi:MAG: hypothetical protein QM640_02780 [Niabella sp.]
MSTFISRHRLLKVASRAKKYFIVLSLSGIASLAFSQDGVVINAKSFCNKFKNQLRAIKGTGNFNINPEI